MRNSNLITSFLQRTAIGCLPLMMLCAMVGCTDAPPARFRLNMVKMVSSGIEAKGQQDIANALTAMFGTPDDPFVLEETGIDLEKLRLAAGAVSSDERGNEVGLYRRHCAHCHGISGDGAGPTAAFLNPYPRDYRRGMFKFKSTERAARPTRDDLKRILHQGIPGTAMPSFRLLAPNQIDAIVEYVVYLSMRGEMETLLASYVADDLDEGESLPGSRDILIDELLQIVTSRWAEAEDQVIRPDPSSAPNLERSQEELYASIAAGRDLFHSEKGACVKCHGPTALGDGETTDYDEWNKAIVKFMEDKPEIEPQSLGALEPRSIRPRNLRQNVFRGGRRPLDLYRRIHAGINGGPMPGTARATPDAEVGLSPEEIWNLVDYVRSLPFESLSEPPAVLLGPKRDRL